MRTLDEHLAAILAGVRPLPPARLPLEQALGLVAAEDAVSLVDLPGFDNSAMDGYAVRAADVAEADPARSWVCGHPARRPATSPPAMPPPSAVRPGQAARIMTGAMLPDGADAVVKVEDTDGGTVLVRIDRGAEPGTSIRRRGEDLARGQLGADRRHGPHRAPDRPARGVRPPRRARPSAPAGRRGVHRSRARRAGSRAGGGPALRREQLPARRRGHHGRRRHGIPGQRSATAPRRCSGC